MAGEPSEIDFLPRSSKRYRESIEEEDYDMNHITPEENDQTIDTKISSLKKKIKLLKRLKRRNAAGLGPGPKEPSIRPELEDDSDGLFVREDASPADGIGANHPSGLRTMDETVLSDTVRQDPSVAALPARDQSRTLSPIDNEIADEPDHQQNNAPLLAGPLQLVIDPRKLIDLTKEVHFVDLTKDDDKTAMRSLEAMLEKDFVHPSNSEFSYHKVVECIVYHSGEQRFQIVRCPKCRRSRSQDGKWLKGVLGVRHHCVHCSINPRRWVGYPSIEAIIAQSRKLTPAQALRFSNEPGRWLKAKNA